MSSIAVELEAAKRRGFLLTRRSAQDAIIREWGRWCDQESIPDIYARIGKTYAVVRLDMAPTGKALSERALDQVIVLLFGESYLEIHRGIRAHPKDHGLSSAKVDRYFRRVGNGDPVVLIISKRVPSEQAERIAEQLAKLAQGPENASVYS